MPRPWSGFVSKRTHSVSTDLPADDSPENYLAPTWFVDSDNPAVVSFARQATAGVTDDRERALRLFYAVRDEIRYSAYGIRLEREHFQASQVLEQRFGWCVTKSCLLAAAARSVGLPCRLGYADVKNHLSTEKLRAWMNTDVFYFHGYNEFWLDGRWIKATVAFNRTLCEKARLKPLDWDGFQDSLYHPYDLEGRRHMEYLHDRGPFADVPYDAIIAQFAEAYPMMLSWSAAQQQPQQTRDGDAAQAFEREVEAESGGG